MLPTLPWGCSGPVYIGNLGLCPEEGCSPRSPGRRPARGRPRRWCVVQVACVPSGSRPGGGWGSGRPRTRPGRAVGATLAAGADADQEHQLVGRTRRVAVRPWAMRAVRGRRLTGGPLRVGRAARLPGRRMASSPRHGKGGRQGGRRLVRLAARVLETGGRSALTWAWSRARASAARRTSAPTGRAASPSPTPWCWSCRPPALRPPARAHHLPQRRVPDRPRRHRAGVRASLGHGAYGSPSRAGAAAGHRFRAPDIRPSKSWR